jgi:assimilatory nitrate reductase catalytic subunit
VTKVIEPKALLKQDTYKKPVLTCTTCPYCGVGCGVEVRSKFEGQQHILSSVQGSADHPANFGRLCVKGSNLLATNGLAGRLLTPQIGGKDADWASAINTVATKFKDVIAKHGPEAVAFYVSGQLLTEDYYVANKLMKGYIGSANIDTNSRLCMSSAVAAYKLAFGADAVPCCYEDLEQTDLLVLIGSNAAWTHPVLYQRLERAKQLNPQLKVVTIDPRRTATSELADLHLAIKPGTDVALFNGLLAYLAAQNCLNSEYIYANTEGFDAALALAEDWSVEKASHYCDLDQQDLTHFYQLFALSDKAISFYSMGVNQSSSGVDKASAIINCHLATGKLGRAGCGPFSITGQPNAMGGREVGGLANLLAAHMDINNEQHRNLVQGFWQSPAMPKEHGLKAVDLFAAIDSGKVKAVWIMATNPLVSMPNRNKIESALQKCEFVVVSDCVAKNDTLNYAHVAFPATPWSEKNGTVTNSERRISRQRTLLAPAGQARPDWQIICDVARAMGFSEGFNFSHPAQIFSEHAALSGHENKGSRDFDISALAGLSESEYEQLKPIQWPVNQANPEGSKRLFSDGKFYTASGKAQFIALRPRAPQQQTSGQYPLILNSGRIRDQWHSMTRTGTAANLSSHMPTPYVAMHPNDAAKWDLREGELVSLSSAQTQSRASQVVLAVKLDTGQRCGELFAPIHWSLTNSSAASIACLFSDANDPLSGQPELKHAAVSLQKLSYQSYGQAVSKTALNNDQLKEMLDFWVLTPLEHGHLLTFASHSSLVELQNSMAGMLDLEAQWLSQSSPSHSNHVALDEQSLLAGIFIQTRITELSPTWLDRMLGLPTLSNSQIQALLRAKEEDEGALICSCFKVGEKAIVTAIAQGADSVTELGQLLKCGTNCGSCKSELSQLLKKSKADYQQDQQVITLVAL